MIIKNCICTMCGKPLYQRVWYCPDKKVWYHPDFKDSEACYQEWKDKNGLGNTTTTAIFYLSKLKGIPLSKEEMYKTRQLVVYKDVSYM